MPDGLADISGQPCSEEKFRQAPDPTLDEVKRLCMALRRRAKDDSVLLHFNGHGVPRPTRVR